MMRILNWFFIIGCLSYINQVSAFPKDVSNRSESVIWSNTQGGIRPVLQQNPHFGRETEKRITIADLNIDALNQIKLNLRFQDNWLGVFGDDVVRTDRLDNSQQSLAAYESRRSDQLYSYLTSIVGTEQTDKFYALRSLVGVDGLIANDIAIDPILNYMDIEAKLNKGFFNPNKTNIDPVISDIKPIAATVYVTHELQGSDIGMMQMDQFYDPNHTDPALTNQSTDPAYVGGAARMSTVNN